MTRRNEKAESRARLFTNLARYGINGADVEKLCRIERALHHWAELECGTDEGCIERDEETGIPYMTREPYNNIGPRTRHKIQDIEARRLAELAKIMAKYPTLLAYHQGDPRGCALYIVDRAALGDRDVHSCYTSFGCAVYP